MKVGLSPKAEGKKRKLVIALIYYDPGDFSILRDAQWLTLVSSCMKAQGPRFEPALEQTQPYSVALVAQLVSSVGLMQ